LFSEALTPLGVSALFYFPSEVTGMTGSNRIEVPLEEAPQETPVDPVEPSDEAQPPDPEPSPKEESQEDPWENRISRLEKGLKRVARQLRRGMEPGTPTPDPEPEPPEDPEPEETPKVEADPPSRRKRPRRYLHLG
jgi:hypothetical protein